MKNMESISLEDLTLGHVFYYFSDQEIYLQNVIRFVESGIKHQDKILIVDNSRNLPRILHMLKLIFTEEQLSSIRLTNNFHYFIADGEFNFEVISKHAQEDIYSFKNEHVSIRTWSHVEWPSAKPSEELNRDYESASDRLVQDHNLLSVCAYNSVRLTPSFIENLKRTHNFVMTDGEFVRSSLYKE